VSEKITAKFSIQILNKNKAVLSRHCFL